MQFQNVISVLNYIKECLENPELKALYGELELRFHPNRSRSRLQALGDFSTVKMQIETLHKRLHPKQWDAIRWNIFRKLDGHRYIGEDAITELNNVLNKPGLTQEVAYEEMKRIGEGMSRLQSEVELMLTRLSAILEADEDGPATPQEADLLSSSLSIFYDKNQSPDALEEVLVHLQTWHDIVIAFNKLIRETVNPPKLIDIEKHPQLILVVSTYPLIIRTIARATSEVLKIRLGALKIRNLRLQTQKVQLNGQLGVIRELEAKFEEAEKASRKEGLEQIRVSFLHEYGWEIGDPSRIDVQLMEALEKLYDFAELGGSIDISQAADDGGIKKSLGQAFGDVVEIDTDIRRLMENITA
jgi:hypothetical protein